MATLLHLNMKFQKKKQLLSKTAKLFIIPRKFSKDKTQLSMSKKKHDDERQKRRQVVTHIYSSFLFVPSALVMLFDVCTCIN